MDSQSAALLRRLNPFCAQTLEAAASLCQTRAHAEIQPEHWLLNQQILPVLSQQLLTHIAAKQKPHSLTLGWNEEEEIVLEFDWTEGVRA
ncbi:hypothetical protein [Candidatus Pantoea floridensis]|uniref:Uncharacterized protein n=1 Tax=Candidatus Pantoea floridensis TaxID=1938870 RepID=A0A286BTD5_9GAMM|nr:hypothetical protein [Pantoea floridensis]PIF23925.1 hypothetical protein BX596_3409 [Enterobacteriaceae bacterium JKS000233]SOD37378.1 hypothetical protein SAMN06273570_1731 [Pantoea floridensis]